MRQIELPPMIIYADGTWDIAKPTLDRNRKNILSNYPWGNPMHGFTLALESDYQERKHNLEPALQIELDNINITYPPLENITPDIWLSRASDVVSELLFRKNLELITRLKETQTQEGLNKLQATYNSIILKDQIASLRDRQAKLNAEIGRRQTKATQHAAALADTALAESRRIVEEEARRLAEAQIDEYKRGLSYVSDVNKYILKQYGEITHNVATELQNGISGKKIRNYDEAIQTFEKVRANPNAKLNPKDTKAIVESLNALDKATFSENLNRLGKAFGVTGRIIQGHSIVEKAIVGFKDDNWKPLMLELESIALGAGAAALLAITIAFFSPALATSALGIVAVALLMATTASIIDADQVDIINKSILDTLSLPQNH